MTYFVAIKINPDNRLRLAAHLKYTDRATQEEYDEYISRFETTGVGGYGFHECLNFQVVSQDKIRFYLPPTCYPKTAAESGDDVCVFSFTTKPDWKIVGVHGLCDFVGKRGMPRREIRKNTLRLNYHAVSEADFTTLFTPALSYSLGTARYCRRNYRQGFRYLSESQARNILDDADSGAKKLIESNKITSETKSAAQRERAVISRILSRYFGTTSPQPGAEGESEEANSSSSSGGWFPDPELGRLGEELVYHLELRAAAKAKVDQSKIEWTASINRFSHCDIKTVRPMSQSGRTHYLEVKTSRSRPPNIFLSSAELEFAESRPEHHSLALVAYNDEYPDRSKIRELSLKEARKEFEFIPMSFRLIQH